MPFLRLLKIPDKEPEITPEPEIIKPPEEIEISGHSDNDDNQQDTRQLEFTDALETLSSVPETVHDSESNGSSDSIQEESEVKAEGGSIPEQIQEEQESESESEAEIEIESEQEIESEPEPETENLEQIQQEQQEPEQIDSESESEPEAESESGEIESESEAEGTETLESIQEQPEEPEELTAQETPEVQEEPEESESESESESPANNEPEEFKLQYDVTSGKRYVDLVSTKTDFDKMLDELASISHDIIEHEAERFAKKYTSKFAQDNNGDKTEADAKKLEAFLGGYIANAAMILYDNGYKDAAIKRLDQAKNMLEARKKLEEETAAIHSRVEENDDMVDLSDILGLFGDG